MTVYAYKQIEHDEIIKKVQSGKNITQDDLVLENTNILKIDLFLLKDDLTIEETREYQREVKKKLIDIILNNQTNGIDIYLLQQFTIWKLHNSKRDNFEKRQYFKTQVYLVQELFNDNYIKLINISASIAVVKLDLVHISDNHKTEQSK